MLPVDIHTFVKDEAPYLAEWIEFHIAQGVRAIHLYDDDSTDNTREVVARYHDFVSIEPAAGRGQTQQYQHLIGTTKEPAWLALTDADEFLYSPMGRPLPEVLHPFEKFGAVAVHWVCYGPCGQEQPTDAPVRQRFTHGTPDRHIKSIVRVPNVCHGGYAMHAFVVDGGCVDDLMRPVSGTDPWPPFSASVLRIDHYATKSVAECMARGDRGNRFCPDQSGAKRLKSYIEAEREWLATGIVPRRAN